MPPDLARLQARSGPVTVEALETILACATVPILRQLEERSPDLVIALLRSSFAEGDGGAAREDMMGWFMRKLLRFDPLRLNLSTCGPGCAR